MVILFSVDFRSIFDVFFWALVKTVDFRGLGNLLLLKLVDFREIARKEPCFVNEKVRKTFENRIKFFSIGICILHKKSTVHCNGFNSLSGALHSNSLTFRIPILLGFFSAKSANSTVFRMCILLASFSPISPISTVFRMRILLVTDIFFCEVYRFQKISETSDAQKNTPLACLFKPFQSSAPV